MGRREEAARWYRRATQLPETVPGPSQERCPARFLWADALYRAGRAGEAREAYDEALGTCPIAPERSWALFQSAKLARRAGDEAAARARVAELLARHPGDYWAQRARELFGSLAAVVAR